MAFGDLSNLSRRSVPTGRDTVFLGPNPLVASSLRVELASGGVLAPSDYSLDSTQCRLVLHRALPTGDSLRLSYRVYPFPYRASIPVYALSPAYSAEAGGAEYPEPHARAGGLGASPLKLEGYFNRQVGAGADAQGQLSGAMDLRLSGQLDNGLHVRGHIVDHALPFQPDGTTAELSQIERIYLQVRDSAWRVEAGDISLAADTAFVAYTHAVQGLGVEYGRETSFADSAGVAFSLGLARAQPQTVHLVGREGVQGPYRLQGEREFLQRVILAGTERVYIDGVRVHRGRLYDYTIDYNLGELRFTTRRPIRAGMRIRVEFQALGRRFPRFISRLNAGLDINPQWSVDLRTLYARDLAARVGGRDADLVRETLGRARPQDERLWVAPRGSEPLVGPMRDSISDEPFTYVGRGKGYYRLTQTADNRPLYVLARASDGSPLGDYRPGYPLEIPVLHTLLQTTATRKSEDNRLSLSSAYSYWGTNTGSRFGERHEHGVALGLADEHRLVEYGGGGLTVHGAGRFVSAGYRSPQSFLAKDFYRGWGLGDEGEWRGGRAFGGRWWDASLGLRSQTEHTEADLTLSQLAIPRGRGLGLGHRLGLNFAPWTLSTHSQHRRSRWDGVNVQVHQADLRLLRQLERWSVGLISRTQVKESGGGRGTSLRASDYAWFEGGVESTLLDTARRRAMLRAIYRQDFTLPRASPTPIRQRMLLSAEGASSHEGGISLGYLANLSLPLRVDIPGARPMDWSVFLAEGRAHLPLWRQRITLDGQAELSSEFSPKMQQHYVRVPTGQGKYEWEDINGDGVPQVDEFFPTVRADRASYVLQLVPSSEGSRTVSNANTLGARLTPRADGLSIGRETPWHERVDVDLRLQYSRSIRPRGWYDLFRPHRGMDDSALVDFASRYAAGLTYNRNAWPLSFRYEYAHSADKQTIPQGVQLGREHAHTIELASPVPARVSVSSTSSYRVIAQEVPLASTGARPSPGSAGITVHPGTPGTRTHRLRKFTSDLTVVYTTEALARHAVSAIYSHLNLPAQIYRLRYVASFPIAGRLSGSSTLGYALLHQPGRPRRTPFVYTHTEGFAPGGNYSLEVALTYRMTRHISTTLTYSLRKPGEGELVQSAFLRLNGVF
ncbi:MAG: hypothetical protein CSA07_04400 [Bacteroidia bacterium]|nr:MAG: hypothetical protein CSA07_04400 [Bacteroidia bacterium]